jgi:hypothetical protein
VLPSEAANFLFALSIPLLTSRCLVIYRRLFSSGFLSFLCTGAPTVNTIWYANPEACILRELRYE